MPSYAPAPIGAVVRYHGSKTAAHGEYVVFGLCSCSSDCALVAEVTGYLDVAHRQAYQLTRTLHQARAAMYGLHSTEATAGQSND